MNDFMTAPRFANKVEWEGGVIEALDYGLKHTHLNPDDPQAAELRAAWQQLEEAYKVVKPLVRKVDGIIEDLPDDEDDEE